MYVTITGRLPATVEEQLAEALQTWPVLGCQVEDVGDELAVTIYLEESESAAGAAIEARLATLGGVGLRTASFARRDWLAEYRKRQKARAIGASFWVDPDPHDPTPAPPGRHHLIIEPRQAFGTGSHESTALLLLLLEDEPPVGARVLDVGTGSSILAIAACRLGAAWVAGLDVDLEAVFVAHQTALSQPRPTPVALLAGGVDAVRAGAAFELVMANILPAQLVPLLPAVAGLTAAHGRLLVSGLMADQRAAVEAELRHAGLEVAAAREKGEWIALVCGHR